MGRAVLASSQQNIELWLTTLITISSPQLCIDLEQLSSRYLLTFLSSGQVWVGRSDNTRIEINLTLRGEPFPYLEFQHLLQSIFQAPAWTQLKLRLTFSEDILPDDGVAYITITDSNDDEPPVKRKCHRILDNVSYTDLQPPEGFPRIQLQVVRFSMDILDTRQRPQLQRSNLSQGEVRANLQQNHDEMPGEIGDDVLLHEPSVVDHDMKAAAAIDQPSDDWRRNKRKRDALQDERNHGHDTSPPTPSLARKLRHRRGSATRSNMSPIRSTPPSKKELADILILVERALRLCITGISKSSTRVKIKANTFSEGLSDIAPVLWKPGYLPALAQRARLIPTIGRSLGNAVAARATSTSLRDKLKRLGPEFQQGLDGHLSWQCLPSDSRLEGLTGLIIERSWLHLQTSLMVRPTPPIQALMNIDVDAAGGFDSDEILEPSNMQQATDNIVPRFGYESDLTVKSNGKQDEVFHDFTRRTSVEHDAAGIGTRSGPIFATRPSSVVAECHDIGPRTHHAGLTSQSSSQDDQYIRHSTYDGSNRIGSSESTALATSHEDQSATIGAEAGRSMAPVDDVLFED